MTRDDVARMAKESGFQTDICLSGADVWIDDGYYVEELKRFAALVAAAEREACAKVAETTYDKQIVWYPKGHYIDPNSLGDINKAVAEGCAAAIRARNEQEQPR